jgi:methylated-DNA-[protein]-cysteine S-methyltransferase
MVTCTCLDTPWGAVAFAASAAGVRALCLPTTSLRRAEAQIRRRCPDAERCDTVERELQEQIVRYFAGHRVRFDAQLDLAGLTPFQRLVLQACATIDYGVTLTYGDLARRIGRPGAARAVGRVMARNPIPLLIPCHRVVGAAGRLTGFSAEGGIDLKRRMLLLEGAL